MRRMKRTVGLLVVLALVGLLAAPAAANVRQDTAIRSGLFGLVTRGPITPTCQEDVPCDEPAANVTLVFRNAGARPVSTSTDDEGRYRVRLQPGVYTVTTPDGAGLEPSRVRVPDGRFARVDFFIDTGIR